MKFTSLVFSLVCLSLSALSFNAYSGLYNYPTVWKVKSPYRQKVQIRCHANPKELPGITLKFNKTFRRSLTHKWTSMHNEGLGLNPAKWTCRSKFAYENSVGAVDTFRTKWGENIILEMYKDSRNRLRVRLKR